MAEMTDALKEVIESAPGGDGIPVLVWKSMVEHPQLLEIVLEVMRTCWKETKVPQSRRAFYMMAIPKTGDLTLLKNWRGLSMANTLSKIFCTILKRRLEGIYEELAPEYCNGFRRGRSRTDSVFTMKQNLRVRKQQGLDSYVVLWDLIKCFDRIPREFVWKSMETLGRAFPCWHSTLTRCPS